MNLQTSYLIFLPDWFELNEKELFDSIMQCKFLLKGDLNALNKNQKRELIIQLAQDMINDLRNRGRVWQFGGGWEHEMAFYGIYHIVQDRNFIITSFDSSSNTSELLAIDLTKICEIYMTAFIPELTKNIRGDT